MLDRHIEGIEVGMENRGLAVHEHMFAFEQDSAN